MTWEPETERRVAALFGEFTVMYGNRAVDYVIYRNKWDEERGQHSQTFLSWCRRLNGLKPGQYKQGIAALREQIQQGARAGETAWPPTPDEFIGLASASHETRIHKNWRDIESSPDLGEGRLLPAPVDDRSADEHLAEIKEIVGIV